MYEETMRDLVDQFVKLYDEDSNMLMCSWFDNLGYPERDLDDKIVFFNSERLLSSRNVLNHFSFSRENKKAFSDAGVEFACKKGRIGAVNQDNFFCVSSGRTKIFGVFDGHGVNGHKASSFAMGAMLDFIKHSRYFRAKPLYEMTDAEVQKALRKTFRYAQDRIKEQYRDYLYAQKGRKKEDPSQRSALNILEQPEGGEGENANAQAKEKSAAQQSEPEIVDAKGEKSPMLSGSPGSRQEAEPAEQAKKDPKVNNVFEKK
jgi:hypothetical protein